MDEKLFSFCSNVIVFYTQMHTSFSLYIWNLQVGSITLVYKIKLAVDNCIKFGIKAWTSLVPCFVGTCSNT